MTKNLEQFIRNFKFVDHDWDKLPEGFPNCDTSDLTLEEKYIFDGIKLTYTNENAGRIVAGKTAKAGMALVVVALAALLSLATLTRFSPNEDYARPVNAATVSATLKQIDIAETIGNAIESTFSGIMKK